MIDEPLALAVQMIAVLAAGMYPVGFLFGVCSDCCSSDCVCGIRVDGFDFSTANNSAKNQEDNADWCCGGALPSQITVRVGNSQSTPASATSNVTMTPRCDEMEGDYVLTLAQNFAMNNNTTNCFYSYEPSCDFECPEQEDPDIDPELPPLFLPGLAIYAYAGRLSFWAEKEFALTDVFVSGSDYKFSVSVFTNRNDEGGHCTVGWGVPATVENTTGSTDAQTGIGANSSEDVLLFQFTPRGLSLRTQFSQQSCDMRGLVSGQITTDYSENPDGFLGYATLNPSHSNGGQASNSVPDCNSVDAKINDYTSQWSNDTSVRFGTFNPICQWDIEILPP